MSVALLVFVSATPVDVTVEGCSFSSDEVRRIVEVELARGSERPVSVVVRCDQQTVSVAVDDAVTGKTLARAFPSAQLSDKNAERSVALTIAELVESGRKEVGLSDSSVRPPEPPPPVSRWSASLLGSLRGTVATQVVQWGAGVRLRAVLAGPVNLALDVFGETGTRKVDVGSVRTEGLSVGAFVLLRSAGLRFRFAGGLGFRGSGERFTGVPADPQAVEGRTIAGVLGGPAALGEATVHFQPLVLSLAVEAGLFLSAFEARASGTTVSGLWGPWVSATIGLGWSW